MHRSSAVGAMVFRNVAILSALLSVHGLAWADAAAEAKAESGTQGAWTPPPPPPSPDDPASVVAPSEGPQVRGPSSRSGFASSATAAKARAARKARAEEGGTEEAVASKPREETPPEAEPASDQDRWVGHLGFGWLGTRTVPYGTVLEGFAGVVETPLIGVRYWFDRQIGLDVGLGARLTSGSTSRQEGEGTEAMSDKEPVRGFLLHAGVPITLSRFRHLSFQLTPEIELGNGSSSYRPRPGQSGGVGERNGFLLQIGVRAGAEVFFGFVGLPALSLEGSAGLYVRSESRKFSHQDDPNQPVVRDASSDFMLTTTLVGQPFDLFHTNVAARYYF